MDAWLPTNEWRWSNSYPQPLPSEEAEFSFPHISLSNSEPLKVGKWRHFFILRGHRKGLEISIHCPLNWEAGWPSWFSPGGNSFIGLFYHFCSFFWGGLRKFVTISALLCLINIRFLFLLGGWEKVFSPCPLYFPSFSHVLGVVKSVLLFPLSFPFFGVVKCCLPSPLSFPSLPASLESLFPVPAVSAQRAGLSNISNIWRTHRIFSGVWNEI